MKSVKSVKVPDAFHRQRWTYRAAFLAGVNGKQNGSELRPKGEIRTAYEAGYSRGAALRARREARHAEPATATPS